VVSYVLSGFCFLRLLSVASKVLQLVPLEGTLKFFHSFRIPSAGFFEFPFHFLFLSIDISGEGSSVPLLVGLPCKPPRNRGGRLSPPFFS